MKNPSILNVKKFFLSLNLFDQEKVYDLQEIKDYDHLFVTISDISEKCVNAVLLCDAHKAISLIEKAIQLSPEKIEKADSTVWTFSLPKLGYISIESTLNSNFIRLDNN